MTCMRLAVHPAPRVLPLTALAVPGSNTANNVQCKHETEAKRFRSRAMHTSSRVLHTLSTDLMFLSFQLHLRAGATTHTVSVVNGSRN